MGEVADWLTINYVSLNYIEGFSWVKQWIMKSNLKFDKVVSWICIICFKTKVHVQQIQKCHLILRAITTQILFLIHKI